MPTDAHPYRSVLYMPGSRPRALEKARSLPADALILDLEDAVAPAEKPRARELVAEAVRAGGYGGRVLLVRVNGLDTEWGEADMAAACAAGPDAILLPKVEGPARLARAAALLRRARRAGALPALGDDGDAAGGAERGGDRLGASAARGVRARDERPREGSAGRAYARPGGAVASLGICLLAARAEGLVCVDGVYNAFQDAGRAPGGLRAGAGDGIRRQDADPSRPDRDRQRGLRAVGRRRGAGREAGRGVRGRARPAARASPWWTGGSSRTCTWSTARQLLARAEAIAALEGAS